MWSIGKRSTDTVTLSPFEFPEPLGLTHKLARLCLFWESKFEVGISVNLLCETSKLADIMEKKIYLIIYSDFSVAWRKLQSKAFGEKCEKFTSIDSVDEVALRNCIRENQTILSKF